MEYLVPITIREPNARVAYQCPETSDFTLMFIKQQAPCKYLISTARPGSTKSAEAFLGSLHTYRWPAGTGVSMSCSDTYQPDARSLIVYDNGTQDLGVD